MHQVAQVLKSNGTDGELVMGFREIAPEDINLKEPVFIYFDGLPVPFFIESFTKRGNTKALVHLTGISSMEDVEEITGKIVYVAKDSLPELTLEEDGYAALVGWTVLTPTGDFSTSLEMTREELEMTREELEMTEEELEMTEEEVEMTREEVEMSEEPELVEVGEITDFVDIPNNPCIEVETENGAVMIPLHEDFILSVDPEYREIIMHIPEGLI